MNEETQKVFESHKSIHLVGVGGIGVSRLAKFFLAQGKKVSGSDVQENEIVQELKQLGLQFFLGHSPQNIPADCDLLVYSLAVPENNTERQEAKKRAVKQMGHFEVLGEISKHYKTIAVAGTNGKSTTTAMIGLILEAAGYDPVVFIGSKVPSWQGNLRQGKGKWLVVEADELGRQFLHLEPTIAVVTNIEADHLDYYKNLNEIREAYEEFLKKVPPEVGAIVYNEDDLVAPAAARFVVQARKVGFGRKGRFVRLKNVSVQGQKQLVEIAVGRKKKQFELLVPGEFSVYNALAAIACAEILGLDFTLVRKALASYHSIWRRFEVLGQLGNASIISDYAHHPTSVLYSVLAVRDFYPGQKILAVFQPHQRHRTKVLFENFVENLVQAHPDGLIISEIFDVAGREGEEKEPISSLDLVEQVSKKLPQVQYTGDLARTEELIRKLAGNYDVILIMGAGDIYKVAEKLVRK